MSEGPRVEISTGVLRGVAVEHGAAFLGVPYAAPPVGELRFVAPQPVAPWDGERDATALARSLPQPPRVFPGLDGRPFMGDGWDGRDPELQLNVWTPDPAASGLPVMVFVHGGAFIAGGPSATGYDGGAFARDGVVLVTVGYRLGAAGFLVLEDGDTNVGLRDQLAALRWVQREVGRFGGDAGNVTVFGQSAGAMSLGAVLGSPQAKGLMHRAILQSGAGQLTFSRAQGLRVAAKLGELLGVEPTAAAVRDVPMANLIDAQAQLLPGAVDMSANGEDDPSLGTLFFLPVRDGDVVPDDPLGAIRAGAGADIPLLVGDTTEEGNLWLAGVPDADPSLAQTLADDVFRRPVAELAGAHRRSGTPTWVYEFAWRSGAVGGRLGAAHALELPFVFDVLDGPGLKADDGLLGAEGAPQELADRMHGAWVRFARDSDPGWAQDAVEVFA